MQPSGERHGLARTSSGIAFFAALGVLTGFAVDATIAALFGAGEQTDAFFIAATIPFALAAVPGGSPVPTAGAGSVRRGAGAALSGVAGVALGGGAAFAIPPCAERF